MFRLGVYFGVAIDLARRGLQDTRLLRPRQVEEVARTQYAGAQRGDRVFLVMHRRSRARQIEDAMDGPGDGDGRGDIVMDEREPGMAVQRPQVLQRAGMQVVDTDNERTAVHQPFAQVRTDETGAASNDHRVAINHCHLSLQVKASGLTMF